MYIGEIITKFRYNIPAEKSLLPIIELSCQLSKNHKKL